MSMNPWARLWAACGCMSLGTGLPAEEIPTPLLTTLSCTTLSGYVDTSAIWKFGTGNNLVGRSYDGTAKQDGFNLDLAKLTLAKTLEGKEWSAGYQADLLFGPDAEMYRMMTGDAAETMAIEQAKVLLRVPVGNNLDLTFGVFDTPFGFEQFDSWRNPNFSRSYGYSLCPRQHTGGVAFYPFADWLAVAAGVANTCSSPINGRASNLEQEELETEKTYVGGLYLTAPEGMGWLKGATLAFVAGNGLNSAEVAIPGHATAYYLGSKIPTPVQGLSLGLAWDYLAWPDFHANAAAFYLSYEISPKLKLHNRLEYAQGSTGTWTGILGTEGMKPYGDEEFLGETVTVEYSLWKNVLSRVEFRWDRDLTGRRGGIYPFGNDDRDALSLALNIVYLF
jgi:hypothetical protein